MSESESKQTVGGNIPWWVKSILLITVTGVFCYKVYQTPVELQFDFPSFLSLLLALFAVGLAAMFYFKATDSSNAFYDNTYKFTRDIADLLVRIESGFGEKLRHLDEGQKGMQDRFDKLPSRLQVEEVKEELKEEEKELQRKIDDRNKFIEDIVAKTQLREEEKKQFRLELKSKEEALQKARNETRILQKQINEAEISRFNREEKSFAVGYRGRLLKRLVDLMGVEVLLVSDVREVKERYDFVKGTLTASTISILNHGDFLDSNGQLNTIGVEFLQRFTRSIKVY